MGNNCNGFDGTYCTFKTVYIPVLTYSFLPLLTLKVLIFLLVGVEYTRILLFLISLLTSNVVLL